MKPKFYIRTVLVLSLLVLQSCGTDRDRGVIPKENLGPFPPLTTRDNVLNNLAASYNLRDISQYDRLLDEHFIFHFSATDVSKGNVSQEQWDRTLELAATTNLFDPAFSPRNGAPISAISLTMMYPKGEESWNEIVDPDTVNFPGETWYEKTVDYLLTVQAGETTFTSGNPIVASFVVRQSEIDGKQIWRIVIWRDDV